MPKLIEFGDTVETSCSAPEAPFGFTAGDYVMSSEGVEIWMKPGVDQAQFDMALAGGAVLVLSDGPLPVGDIIAIFLVAGAYYALLAGAQSGAYQPLENISLPTISFSSAQTVTAGQALETEAVIPWPQPTWSWKTPDFDWDAAKHAALHRNWPTLMVMLVYLEVTEGPDAAYFGPSSGRFLLMKQISGYGLATLIFEALPQNAQQVNTNGIQITRFLTLYIDSRARVAKIRSTNCASWQVWKAIGYDPSYEPSPAGTGTCFANNNNNISGFVWPIP